MRTTNQAASEVFYDTSIPFARLVGCEVTANGSERPKSEREAIEPLKPKSDLAYYRASPDWKCRDQNLGSGHSTARRFASAAADVAAIRRERVWR